MRVSLKKKKIDKFQLVSHKKFIHSIFTQFARTGFSVIATHEGLFRRPARNFFTNLSNYARIINLNDKRSSPYAARTLPNRGYTKAEGDNAVHI